MGFWKTRKVLHVAVNRVYNTTTLAITTYIYICTCCMHWYVLTRGPVRALHGSQYFSQRWCLNSESAMPYEIVTARALTKASVISTTL